MYIKNIFFPKAIVTFFHSIYLVGMISAISIFFTAHAVYMLSSFSWKVEEDRFNSSASIVEEGIKARMNAYEQVLLGGVGLFNSTGEVSRTSFHDYVSSLKIDKNFPGIQGIGFSIPLKPEELPQHINSIKAEGFNNYTIRPTTKRKEYSSIIYLEPFDWRNKRAFGYDMWSNEVRRQAMTKARDSGKPAMSGLITLVQETKEDIQKGFLTYLPVYNKGMKTGTIEEKRASFKGWVYSPFRAGDLMKGILGTKKLSINFELFDSTYHIKNLLYDSDASELTYNNKSKVSFHKESTIELNGRSLKLLIHSQNDGLNKSIIFPPLILGVFGLAVNILLFLFTYSLYRSSKKTKAQALELAIQKQDLEIANKELSQFAYITSHDLQEPLRTISNYSNILNKKYIGKLGGDGDYVLNTISSATKRMSNLIYAILEYSRLGRLNPSDIEEIDTNLMLDEIEKDLEFLFQKNKVRLDRGNLPSIHGHKTMVKQLFTNLISNAIKYKKADTPPIIKIEGYLEHDRIKFSIHDNGIGIEKKYHHKIFQIFQRLHNSQLYNGTGIGLSTCKKIVDLHKGKIWVKSDLDEGSIFSFFIPISFKLKNPYFKLNKLQIHDN